MLHGNNGVHNATANFALLRIFCTTAVLPGNDALSTFSQQPEKKIIHSEKSTCDLEKGESVSLILHD